MPRLLTSSRSRLDEEMTLVLIFLNLFEIEYKHTSFMYIVRVVLIGIGATSEKLFLSCIIIFKIIFHMCIVH